MPHTKEMRIALSTSVLALTLGLLHCGPAMPVKATLVSCADKTPIPNAQVDHLSEITRTHEDGTWSSTVSGSGALPVDIYHSGFKRQKFQLKPGEEGQTICLTPE